ncbi:MAG: flagellar motor switch protein FliN [Clostridia bacterium]|nr:flagellar motor switch protein FliN [Clostridia bacterium]
MADNFLSQEEIDALLKGTFRGEVADKDLTETEKDVLGEIGNISMGSAATTLSQILNKRVTITTPSVRVTTPKELFESFEVPYLAVEVTFTEGLEGVNLLIIKVSDASVIADLMMGGSGLAKSEVLTEIQISAVAEAMNQMIGSAATSMSTIFQRSVKISPPTVTPVDLTGESLPSPWPTDSKIAVVSFKMEIEGLVNSEIMQVMPLEIAKLEADLLLNPSQTGISEIPPAGDPAGAPQDFGAGEVAIPPAQPDGNGENRRPPAVVGASARNLDLILDVPLDISVVLGETDKPIRDILELAPGAIVELERNADEPVEILVNGTLIARGEVVIVNENFGVRITDILDPYERVNQLRK